MSKASRDEYPFVSICDPSNACFEDCENLRLDDLATLLGVE